MSISPKKKTTSKANFGGKLGTEQIAAAVETILESTEFLDMHTHLFPPAFGKIGLWGIDELVTYHYLEAEFFRSSDMTPDQYWKLPKRQQADAIWKALFVENAPISEATRGVIAVLKSFGLPTESHDLRKARAFFESQKIEKHIAKVFEMAGVGSVVMTNDPLDPGERPIWMSGGQKNKQFHAALRLDGILCTWDRCWQQLASQGYQVDANLSGKTTSEIRRFLADWCQRMQPLYMAVSLEDTFQYPDNGPTGKVLSEAVLPACREFGMPMSLMIGVRRQVNPALRLAGDGAGRADLRAVETLCRNFPSNRFLVSVLSLENQHELCVYARKFANLMPFGCWWFLNNISVVEEITRERIEMLGATFIAQHSDARVLEQVIYKWRNARLIVGRILTDTYRLLVRDGRPVTGAQIQQDVDRLFRKNFEKFTGLRAD